ncbi:hypothetical protein GH714_004913 [Hevea brasiliensis]|uniref:Uncharacterized protein n=1 Tax=Hevea brasiliensis TaxID=3981 RepID=A0A6A6LCS8_HEVBR|nr:hypothetical protein GH714_004913 [Hevea brasiliensis]
MENKFQNLGFASNYPSNAFNILGSLMQVGGAVAEYSADTILRLDSPGSSVTYRSPSKGVKRKWNLIDGSMGQCVGSSLSLGLGRSSSSSDSKGSSATVCTTMSSAKETDEESSMELELDFSLHLGNDKMSSQNKSASSNLKELELQPKVDLELSLSTGPSESDITSVYPYPNSTPFEFGMEMPLAVGGATNADEGSTSCSWKTGITLLLPLIECDNSAKKFSNLYFWDNTAGNSHINAALVPSCVRLRDVEREPEVLLAVAFHMVVAEGVRNQVATRELRAGLCTARPMGVDGDVNSLVAQKVQKVAQIFVFAMVVVEDAVVRVALGLQEGNQDCAFGMVVGKDVKKKTAQKVQKASQAFAFHMEVVVDAKR